ncbi:ATP-binding protein [Novosphingobium sp.]|uniref:sensor histidine kinase n=1 Tax=Novosphingobium sp. TaxID=1874826 RepID=UPI0033410A41
MSRMILAAVFLLAVRIQPSGPSPTERTGLVLLAVYLGWTGVVARIAWRSWWWDFRMARAVHAIDIGVFIGAVFLTEINNSDFGSPFIAFAAFLLITAANRAGWNGVVLTALTLIAGYGLTGGAVTLLGYDIDPYRFGRHQTYMIALAIMISWLSADQRAVRLSPMTESPGIPGERSIRVMADTLAFARTASNATHAAIAVAACEEPGIDIYRDSDGVFTHERIGPGTLPDDFATDTTAALFDVPRNRRIVLSSDNRLAPAAGPFNHALADACLVSCGLVGGFASATSQGQLLVWGMADACIDDLPVIATLARDIGTAVDREAMAVLARTLAVAHVRNAVARDLHDSAAQFLAGTQFRLESLRRWIRDGRDPDAEITAIKLALRGEQSHLVTVINRLRLGIDGDRTTDLVAELEALTAELADHWHVATALSSACRPLDVSMNIAHELRQVVREAVANAVRHGHCRQVTLDLARTPDGAVRITITDDGIGLPPDKATLRPRSISERIDALGGQMQIATGASGTSGLRLGISLPAVVNA